MKYRATQIFRRKNRLEFDPNGQDSPQWATYIPRRSPSWKVHSKKGQACGAVSNAVNSAGYGNAALLFEFLGGKWVERGRAEPVEFCAHCGEESDDSYRRLMEHPGKYQFEKPFVCRPCYNKHFKNGAKEPLDPSQVVIPR